MASAPGKHQPWAPRPKTEQHQVKERRGSARQRGYNKRWERFRAAFLREHPLCEYCLAKGRIEPATVCDHDLPHERDSELFWDNTFTALCRTCHSVTKQSMERQFRGDALLDAIRRAKGKA